MTLPPVPVVLVLLLVEVPFKIKAHSVVKFPEMAAESTHMEEFTL